MKEAIKIEIGSLSGGRKHYSYEDESVAVKALFDEVYSDIAWRLDELNLQPQVVVPVVHVIVGGRHKCYLYDMVCHHMKKPPKEAIEAVAARLEELDLPGYYSVAPVDKCKLLRFTLHHGRTGEVLAILYEDSDGALLTDYLYANTDELVSMQGIIKSLLQREQENLGA